jgi:protein involved in polysaccharide export with SLBB domain
VRRLARGVLLLACWWVASGATGARFDPEDVNPSRTAADAKAEKIAAETIRRAPTIIQAGPVDATRYVLGPGDVLELDVWGRVSNTIMLSVSPEGTIFLPATGTIDVSGKTLASARQRILDRVGQQLRDVRADVRLVQLRSFKVFVAGAVKEPGAVEVTSATRASEVVSTAGIAEKGSRRNILIQRRDHSAPRLDLQMFEILGRESANPAMVDGDILTVPQATQFVEIFGAVGRAGAFELAPGDSLSTLIALAGGLQPAAVSDRALLVRFSDATSRESLWVDPSHGPGSAELLHDGDRVFIQFQAGYHLLPSAGIYGEVERPGSYPLEIGRDRVSDLVRWAGGFRPRASRTALRLLRETGASSERDPEFDRLVRLSRTEMTESEYARFQTMLSERKNVFRIDWSRIQREGADVDPLLREGDVVWVDQLVSSVRVEGEVRRPGFVDYVSGRTLDEYVALAGGYTDRAAKRNIRISRSETGQVIPAKSVASIQPGDFVWIPEKKDVDSWAIFRDVVTIGGQVAVIIFTLSRR